MSRYADRMEPRNLPISDFSRWLSPVNARADDRTCEEADPVSLAPR